MLTPEPEADPELPEVLLTANQVIAFNMAAFRRASGMTQEEFGERVGWSAASVSAAERSWDGKRVKKFDADELAMIADVLGVPVAAFFLPPADDGTSFRYSVETGGRAVPMAEFFAAHFEGASYPAAGSGPVARAYEDALIAASARYGESSPATVPGEKSKRQGDDARLEAALRRAFATSGALYRLEEAMRLLREDNDFLQDMLLAMMRQGADGRKRLEAIDAEHRQASWAELRGRPEARRQQEHMIALAREMFGDRGPANGEDYQRLIEAARERGLKGPPRAMTRLIDGESELIAQPDGQLPAGEES